MYDEWYDKRDVWWMLWYDMNVMMNDMINEMYDEWCYDEF